MAFTSSNEFEESQKKEAEEEGGGENLFLTERLIEIDIVETKKKAINLFVIGCSHRHVRKKLRKETFVSFSIVTDHDDQLHRCRSFRPLLLF